MVICCSALGCKNRQNSLNNCGNKLSFHRFPRDKDVCEAWLVASQRLDFVPSKYSYLCSEHFTEDQFNITQKGLRLRPNAVPTVFQVMPKPKRVTRPKKVSEVQPTVKIASKKVSEVQPKVKIAPKQLFEVRPTVKIAPKQAVEIQPTVKIAPKQVFDAQTPITTVPQPVVSEVSVAPGPVITNLSTIANTVVSSNLIHAALSAYKQSTNSAMSLQQPNGTPVSIYVVHPQPNGSNIVTIPSIENLPPYNAGTVPTLNGGSLPKAGSQYTEDELSLEATLKNIEKIKKYEEKLKHYRKEINKLHQSHRRQSNKIEKLQNIIKELRSPSFIKNEEEEEEESVSEDMSEDEIYAELLKHQSANVKEDIADNCQT